MQWFHSLSAKAKLLLSFIAVAGIAVTIGWIGLSKMGTINDKLTVMYERDLVGLKDVATARASLLRLRSAIRQALITSDLDEVRRIGKDADELVDAFETALTATEKNIVSAEGKAGIAQIRKDFPVYVGFAREAIRLRLANDMDGAKKAVADGGPPANRLEEAMDKTAGTKITLAEEANAESNRIYASARTLVIGFIIGGAALAIVLGYLIARWFTTALLEVAEIATTLASASQQLSAASEEISSGAQEQAANLEETASSLEEITSTVKQNADNAQQANQLASGSRDVAEKGGQVVSNAIEGMNEINQASKKIADIITAIDEIAFQTNLLALNAAVEAARAGEQGRGFAVVAGEVRNLAQRSAAAAKEIKGLIQDSVRKVETGSELVNTSGQTLQEIVTSVKRVTDIVAEIAAASREQSSGIDQVSKAVAQMDSVTQANASQTEELSGTAQALAGQAERLQEVVAQFNLQKDTRPAAKKQPAPKVSTLAVGRPAKKEPSRNGKHQTNGHADDLDLVGAGAGGNRLNGHFEEF